MAPLAKWPGQPWPLGSTWAHSCWGARAHSLSLASLLMSLSELYTHCQQYPALLALDYDQISLYLSFIWHFKPWITFTQASTQDTAPYGLLCTIHQFIRKALNMEDGMAFLCWTVLKDLAWDNQECIHHLQSHLFPCFFNTVDKHQCVSLNLSLSLVQAHLLGSYPSSPPSHLPVH